ncbi:hypothetical protein STANM309S_06510 [Streptomyces tanashiensis]
MITGSVLLVAVVVDSVSAGGRRPRAARNNRHSSPAPGNRCRAPARPEQCTRAYRAVQISGLSAVRVTPKLDQLKARRNGWLC